mmetsp:Transcript_11961/g.35836  ORF Transcript_11961/g.35836 Transcript_11961/m.35836 type:complete len:480 (-) Transcript_11961:160-1599(-)
MDVKSTDFSGIFRAFTACGGDPKTFVFDVRPHKQFQKSHVALAYNVRVSANGQALLDYSKNQYDVRFSKDCWWGQPVVVYGDEGLRKDNPVVKFLAQEKRCKSIHIFKHGYAALEKKLPYICTQSLKANCARKYPSEILPGEVYLGEWSHAEAHERLLELNVRRVVTIHNSPENMELPAKFKHLRFQLADVDTQNVAPFFNTTYDFVEEGRAAGHATLIHCGAGVSRSAALTIAYLMRRFTWNASKARAHVAERRSAVYPNDGFWRSLCALESQLGIDDRSDINQGTVAWHGNDAPVKVAEDAAGKQVVVTFLTVKELAAEAAAAEEAKQRAAAAATAAAERAQRDADREKRRSSHHDADRRRHRSRSRSRDRSGRTGGGGGAAGPDLLQMSYDEYLEHFERVRQQKAAASTTASASTPQGGFQQQQQQQRGGAGSGQVLMSEQAYIQHCQQLATANGTPFDLQAVRRFYHQMAAQMMQ